MGTKSVTLAAILLLAVPALAGPTPHRLWLGINTPRQTPDATQIPTPTVAGIGWSTGVYREMTTSKQTGPSGSEEREQSIPAGRRERFFSFVSPPVASCTGGCEMAPSPLNSTMTYIDGLICASWVTGVGAQPRFSWHGYVMASDGSLRCMMAEAPFYGGFLALEADQGRTMYPGPGGVGSNPNCKDTALQAGDRVVFEAGAVNSNLVPTTVMMATGGDAAEYGTRFIFCSYNHPADYAPWFTFYMDNSTITWATELPTATGTATATPSQSRTHTTTVLPTDTPTDTPTDNPAGTSTRTSTPTPQAGCRYDVLTQTGNESGVMVVKKSTGTAPGTAPWPSGVGNGFQCAQQVSLQEGAEMYLDPAPFAGCMGSGNACTMSSDCCPELNVEDTDSDCVALACSTTRDFNMAPYTVAHVTSETVERWDVDLTGRTVESGRVRLLVYQHHVVDLGGMNPTLAAQWTDVQNSCTLAFAGDGTTANALSSTGNCGALCTPAEFLTLPEGSLTEEAWHEFPLDNLDLISRNGTAALRFFMKADNPCLATTEGANVFWAAYEADPSLAPQLILETCPEATPTPLPCSGRISPDVMYGGFKLTGAILTDPTPVALTAAAATGNRIKTDTGIIAVDGATTVHLTNGGRDVVYDFGAAGLREVPPLCGTGPLIVHQTGSANVDVKIQWREERN